MDRPSREVYDEIAEQVLLADALGIEYGWFSEHHAHAHYGHLPSPLLYALHLVGRTRQIHLGTAIICLNLHHPVAVAEEVAVADILAGGRISPGFGSGSTPEEFRTFGMDVTDPHERHDRFEEALRIILAAWRGEVPACSGRYQIAAHRPLPLGAPDLAARSWLAVNSVDSARIAGRLGFNMMFSHLRTPEQYREYRAAYAAEGGAGLVAANRPVYVAATDAEARAEAEPALRTLWRRFQQEGKIPAEMREPSDIEGLSAHPINFLVGGPERVAAQIAALHAEVPFDVINLEPQWAGLTQDQQLTTIRLLATAARPLLYPLQ